MGVNSSSVLLRFVCVRRVTETRRIKKYNGEIPEIRRGAGA